MSTALVAHKIIDQRDARDAAHVLLQTNQRGN